MQILQGAWVNRQRVLGAVALAQPTQIGFSCCSIAKQGCLWIYVPLPFEYSFPSRLLRCFFRWMTFYRRLSSRDMPPKKIATRTGFSACRPAFTSATPVFPQRICVAKSQSRSRIISWSVEPSSQRSSTGQGQRSPSLRFSCEFSLTAATRLPLSFNVIYDDQFL